MLICRQTICTRTIGNKKIPTCGKAMPSGLAFLPHFWIVHASKLMFVEFFAWLSTFAVQHRKPWGVSWFIPVALGSFFFPFFEVFGSFLREFFVTIVYSTWRSRLRRSAILVFILFLAASRSVFGPRGLHISVCSGVEYPGGYNSAREASDIPLGVT